MSTYIVEVDSTYRDADRYQTQTDFAVSFQTNTSSDYFVEGLPLNTSSTTGTYYNNFFTKCSIDPDYKNTNLQVTRGTLTDLQRRGDEFYLSGICLATGSTGFSITYSTGTLVKLYDIPDGKTTPFLCKLTRQVDESYVFNWISYIYGSFNPSGPLGSNVNDNAPFYTTHSIVRISVQNNLFWMFDSNYYSLQVQVYSTGSTGTTLYSMINPSEYANSINNYIVSLNSNGYYSFVENRPWGYHILYSNWNLYDTNENGRINLLTDDAENLYVSSNIADSYYPHIYGFSLSGAWVNNVYSIFPAGSFICSLTGITGATGGTQKYFLQAVDGNSASTLGVPNAVSVFTTGNTLYDFSFKGNIPLTPAVTNDTLFYSFVSVNNKVYVLCSYYSGSSALALEIRIFQLDIYNLSVTSLATTTETFYIMFFNTVVSGTKLLFTARTTRPGSIVYVYEFETTTNTLTTRASLAVESSTVITAIGCLCTINPYDSNQLIIATQTSSSTNVSANLLFLSYNITTYSLVLQSSILGYSDWQYGMYQTINNRLHFITSWNVPSVIGIIDISSISSPQLSGIIQTVANATLFTFTKQDPNSLTTNIFLNVGNSVSFNNIIYNINNPENPYVIVDGFGNQLVKYNSTNNLAKGTRVNTLYDHDTGYVFGVSPNLENQTLILARTIPRGGSVFKSQFINQDLYFYSSHYNQNLSTNTSLTIGTTFTVQNVLQLSENDSYIFVGSSSSISIYKVNNIIGLSLYSSITLSSPLSSNPISLDTISVLLDDGTTRIYLAICDTASCQIYSSNSTYTSWTLILTILPATVLATNRFLYKVLFSKNETANTPGIYLLTCDRNVTIRKWTLNISLNTISLVATSTPFVSDFPTALAREMIEYYYIEYNLYCIFVRVSSGGYKVLNITEPSVLNILGTYNPIGGATKLVISRLPNGSTVLLYPPVSSSNNSYQPCSLSTVGGGSVLNSPYNSFIFNFILSNQDKNLHYGCVSWTDSTTNRQYVAWNSGDNTISPYDSLNIADITSINAAPIITQNEVTFTGQVLDIQYYQTQNRTILVNLINNGSLYLYDVSNPSFAGTTQLTKESTSIYSNLQGNGCSIVHNISNIGVPSWLNVIGSVQSDQMGYYSNSSGLVLDEFFNLYVVGNWSRRVDFFQTHSSTGASYVVQKYPVNEFLNSFDNTQEFIGKIRIDTGDWLWVLPLVGNNSITSGNIRYSSKYNSLFTNIYFSSQNQYVFYKQISQVSPTGYISFSGYGLPQLILNNTSNSTSGLLTFDIDGNLKWNVVLRSTLGQTFVSASSLWIDETLENGTLVLSGLSNTTTLEGFQSDGQPLQNLYPQIDPLTQTYLFCYSFTVSTGTYVSSQYISAPINTIIEDNGVRCYSDLDELFILHSEYTPVFNQSINLYNKDSTLGGQTSLVRSVPLSLVSVYQNNSIYQDFNTFNYSRVFLYDYTGSPSSLTGSLTNYNVFVLGSQDDTLINKDFIIRESSYDFNTNTLVLTLNQQIQTSQLIRIFSNINGITGSSNYYSSNLSSSPLYDIGKYSTGGVSVVDNSITFDYFVNNTSSIDLSKQYYFVFPQQTGTTGTYTDIVPITSISYNSSLEKYTVYVNNINDLRVPSPSGSLYGPYLYLSQKNYSAFYSLQWYPGSRVFSQSYLVGLYDLIIPNRPVRNSRYPGQRFLSDYPYVYLVIYNANEEDNFDSSVVNSVYDNNVDVPRFALFQLPTTNFVPTNGGNYFTASSSATPKIRFTPGFYYLHFKLTDDRGNVILFDNTPYKDTDTIFSDGVVPESLLNMTVRLAFKKG